MGKYDNTKQPLGLPL